MEEADNSTTVVEAAVNNVTYQDLVQFKYLLEGVVLTPISIFGLIGNALSIFVLSCPEMRSNFNQLLIGLASFDLLYLLLSVTIFSVPKLSSWYTEMLLPHIMPIGYGFAHIGRVGSVLMTLSVTIERFFAISYPLQPMNLKNGLIVSSVISSIVYNIPRFFELETASEVVISEETGENVTVYTYVPTPLRFNSLYVQIYVVWMKFILIEILPYIIILMLNIFMIIRIRKAMRLQREMTTYRAPSLETQRKEMNMAVVLVCIVIMFICCQSVKIIPDFYEAIYCDHSSGSCESMVWVETTVSVSYVLLGINSASNFIIYMLRGDKFRRVLSRKICQLCKRQPSPQFDSPRNGYASDHLAPGALGGGGAGGSGVRRGSSSHHSRMDVSSAATVSTKGSGSSKFIEAGNHTARQQQKYFKSSLIKATRV